MLMKWLIRLAFPALGVLVALMFFGLNDPAETTSEPAKAETNAEIPAFEAWFPHRFRLKGPTSSSNGGTATAAGTTLTSRLRKGPGTRWQ